MPVWMARWCSCAPLGGGFLVHRCSQLARSRILPVQLADYVFCPVCQRWVGGWLCCCGVCVRAYACMCGQTDYQCPIVTIAAAATAMFRCHFHSASWRHPPSYLRTTAADVLHRCQLRVDEDSLACDCGLRLIAQVAQIALAHRGDPLCPRAPTYPLSATAPTDSVICMLAATPTQGPASSPQDLEAFVMEALQEHR